MPLTRAGAAAICDGIHRQGDGSFWAKDARGIEIARVCPKCIKRKLAGYRREVLTNPNYQADEPIDPDT